MIYYDSHVHVFNATMLSSMVNLTQTGVKGVRPKGLVSCWSWISDTFYAIFNSPKAHNRFILSHMKEAFPNASEYATVPLMMDLEYMFCHSLEVGQKVPDAPLYVGDKLQDQIDDLQKLSAAGNCYPFFAVDPRRPGVIDAVMSGKFVTRKPGGFYGIKLYPRLGYHPMSGKLPELYAWCAKNGIPVTTHCSSGGFPNWNTPSGAFCDPECFRPALEANPSLKIDIAHFGYGNQKWGESIVDLMTKFPGVYSDLSCYTGVGDLSSFKNSFWSNPIVRQRTMYGSDYDIFVFTKFALDMGGYLLAFRRLFTSDELAVMASSLPEAFLGLPAADPVGQ